MSAAHAYQFGDGGTSAGAVGTPAGAVGTAGRTAHELTDGSAVLVDETSVEIRDAEDRLVFRYEDGALELIAPQGDVRLRAPHGAVALEGQRLDFQAELIATRCTCAPAAGAPLCKRRSHCVRSVR